MRTSFPSLDYYRWVVRVLAFAIWRVPALAVVACLLLPLAQPQIDTQHNSKYVISLADFDLDDLDGPREPEVVLVQALKPRHEPPATICVRVATDGVEPTGRHSEFLPPPRGPPLAIS